ncbi:prolyl oligopeptidase family serine peptidase [Flavobacteriaceae bacterium D16]|nr:prolyl oligopeptidase family serine peptidase [Flavobacteriaceae bacterium D16]
MRTFRFISVLLALLIAAWSCERDEADSLYDTPLTAVDGKGELHKSKLQNRVLVSEALADNFIGNHFVRKMQVYTPPGYKKNGDRAYPVVYLLHGLPFSEKAYIDQSTWDPWVRPGEMWPFQAYPDFPAEGFRKWVDQLIEDGKIEPMIIVMPNADSEALYGFSFYTNSILNGNFEDFIVEDVVAYMDSHYNTIADPSGRAVVGHSQGGYAAFKFGLLHPDVFGTVASHSGLLLVDALLSQGAVLVAENPDGFMGPDPQKFLTSAGYAMSACWSPNLDNPPFFVDFPIDYNTGAPIPEVAMKWYANDVFTMIDSYLENFKSLDGIYLDIGMNDELGMQMAYPFLVQKLDAYGVDYTYETFNGGHFTSAFERLGVSLEFISDTMNP